MIPTRWKTLFDDQLTDATRRMDEARQHAGTDDGSRAMQGAYQAVVTAAGVRVWMVDHPWETTVPAAEMQRKAAAEFPSRFAALVVMDVASLLTGFWSAEAARPYLDEAETFVRETRERFDAWVAGN